MNAQENAGTMTPPDRGTTLLERLACVGWAIGLVAAAFGAQGRIGLDLSDEGFLWYGAQRVLQGDVPIRDFMSYDPGRYYWSAIVMWAIGSDGIVSLRAAVALFQAAGLSLATIMLWRATRSRAYVAVCTSCCLLWMLPRHKLFEHSISIALVATTAWLLEHPSRRRCLASGVVLGLTAFMGRNHGIYGFLMMASTLLLSRCLGRLDNLRRAALQFFAGLLIGSLPLLIMLATLPGFADAFADGIRFLISVRGATVPRPAPFPWRLSTAGLSLDQTLQQVSIGCLFLLLPVACAGAWLVIGRGVRAMVSRHPLFVACALGAPVYMHHAFSRADAPHLAQGIMPALMGAMYAPLLLEGRARSTALRVVATLALGVTVISVAPLQPLSSYLRSPSTFQHATIRGDELLLDRATHHATQVVRKVSEQVPLDESLLITPHWITMYSVLGRKSPVWEIYVLYPRLQTEQAAEIERLVSSRTRWIILGDTPLDGRDELRFRNLRPEIWRFIEQNFRPEPLDDLIPGYSVYTWNPR